MGCGKSTQANGGNNQLQQLKANKSGAGAEDIRDKYDIGEILGSGSFGQVRQARLKENATEVRAVKMIERDDQDGEWSNQAMFVREVELLQTIDHTNIIRYYDFYEDPHFLYVVMELCSGGEVFQKILELKRFQETDASAIGRQMLSAVNYIHQMGICHRDIKAENFMFAENSISSPLKMIDFGMATKFTPNQVLTELCGSPHYLSPELIGQKYNQSADLWAFGVLLYLLMYGRYPYDGKNPQDIMTKILMDRIEWRHDKAKLSENAIDFLKRLLERNPRKRINAEEALKHTWMQPKQPKKEDASKETIAIPTDVIRSAHKKATATRKEIDKKVEELRNQKLKQIDEDFSKGIRYGNRIGPTPQDATFLQKPEFVRRDNKLTTAPSREMGMRRTSMDKMISKLKGQKIEEGDEKEEQGKIQKVASSGDKPGDGRWGQRAASYSDGKPRRLSYMGDVTEQDEKKFSDLYKELKEFSTEKGEEKKA
eukprot:gnl/MRDRNA2_/MRDRNA2_160646_c0_seq1.p1 gnl/MRDRNA2_/MRDRNA2_160646_c0~~gnl/MRDRNA2_/MRDRNA2_160646_c0_seq1.p1  ORF type:complete len:484 (+),score=112.67 gnl/MRDRNA2_/MRDRNA2_160646_c0_seq1:204-1655(+)